MAINTLLGSFAMLGSPTCTVPNIYDLKKGEPSFSINQSEGDAKTEILKQLNINMDMSFIATFIKDPFYYF